MLLPKTLVTSATTALVLAATACSTARGHATAAPAITQAGSACVSEHISSATLRLEHSDFDDLAGTLVVQQSDNPQLTSVVTASGPCADHIAFFRMSRLYLDTGAVLEIGPELQLTASSALQSVQPLSGVIPHPEIDGLSFVAATQVDLSAKQTAYVGLWESGDVSRLYAFETSNDGKLSDPKLILSSSAPLVSVSYFPSPDTNSGRLGIVQKAQDKVRLLSLDWGHSRLSSVTPSSKQRPRYGNPRPEGPTQLFRAADRQSSVSSDAKSSVGQTSMEGGSLTAFGLGLPERPRD